MAGRAQEDERRREVVHVCHRLYERGLVAGQDGNVSVRLDAERLLATPAGWCKGDVRAEHLVVTDLLVDVYKRGKPENWAKQKRLFELIADPVEDVAPWLVERVLAGPKHGEHVAWMTVPKAILRAFRPKYWRRNLFAGRL